MGFTYKKGINFQCPKCGLLMVYTPKTTAELMEQQSEKPSFTIIEPEEIRCLDCGFLIALYQDNEGEKKHNCPVCNSCNVVEKPQRETPEEFKDRTGRPWADGSAVYMKVGKNDWRMVTYREAKFTAKCCEGEISCLIYCANSDAGIPENTRRRKRRKRNETPANIGKNLSEYVEEQS